MQTGFGWSNGVVIDFAVTFGDELMAPDDYTEFFREMVELATQMDMARDKSKLVAPRRKSVTSVTEGAATHPAAELLRQNMVEAEEERLRQEEEEKVRGAKANAV